VIRCGFEQTGISIFFKITFTIIWTINLVASTTGDNFDEFKVRRAAEARLNNI
jgi:hypothetical protein